MIWAFFSIDIPQPATKATTIAQQMTTSADLMTSSSPPLAGFLGFYSFFKEYLLHILTLHYTPKNDFCQSFCGYTRKEALLSLFLIHFQGRIFFKTIAACLTAINRR